MIWKPRSHCIKNASGSMNRESHSGVYCTPEKYGRVVHPLEGVIGYIIYDR